MGVKADKIPEDGGITIKPMSEFKTKRHVRKALRYALANGRKRVTLVGKGNIMQATEGAFLRWGKEVGEEAEFKSFKKVGMEAKAMGTEEFGRAIAERIGG